MFNEAMIELNNTTKLYGHVIGVNDLTLTLPTGAYGLVGPNGSGKTTLINLLIGHLRPTLGSVSVFGKDPFQHREMLSRIGLCPATDILYPNISARSWVTYLVRLHGYSRRQSESMAEAALGLVGMSSAMDRPIGTYSLGMRQRTKIAQAIAHHPDLLILDEPYNGLDPVGRDDMTTLLKQWTQQGKGLLFASHVLQEIEAVTSSFLLIFGGRLLASGTADEIESILSDTPQEVRVIGRDAPQLIHHLVDMPWVNSLQLTHQRSELRIALRDPSQFYEHIADWIAADGLQIDQLQTADGNLAALFASLLKHHRGESA